MTTIKANGRDLELKTDQDIALYPTNNIWISQGTKLIFEGTIPDDFEVKLQATSVTADRDLILPDSDGTIATQEWANAQSFGGGGGSLNNVVEDTTPQLGGDLDLNGNDITGTGNISINGDISSTSAGTPTITSSTDIALTAGTGATNKVEVTQSPFKLANLTDAQRDALTAENGYMIYNTDDNRFQAYQNGAWVRLDFSAIV